MTQKLLSGKTRVAGVIGSYVGHSLSPRLHSHWLHRLNIDGAYIPLPVSSENLAFVLRSLAFMNFAGVNITIPHKETAFRIVDETDDLSWQVGAVNTIDVLPNGRLRGRNTDVYGFMQNLQQNISSFDYGYGPALVLGAGGAARAVIIGLVQLGVPEIWISNRTRERADNLATLLRDLVPVSINVISWDQHDNILPNVHMIVNTTSLGMYGQPDLDLNLAKVKGNALITDIVYTPLMTKLLMEAQAHGLSIVDGLGMLLHQAQPGFEAWFGAKPPVDMLAREMLLSAVEQSNGLHTPEPAMEPEITQPMTHLESVDDEEMPNDYASRLDDWIARKKP